MVIVIIQLSKLSFLFFTENNTHPPTRTHARIPTGTRHLLTVTHTNTKRERHSRVTTTTKTNKQKKKLALPQYKPQIMSQVYTAAEIATHNKEGNLWIVYKKKVYDISKYADEHPGGLDTLLEQAGKDATAAFDNIGHTKEARETMHSCLIGELDPNDASTLPAGETTAKTSYTSLIIIATLLAACLYMIAF